jgi:endonuclease/exonuclease/phosphatase family metal-dependent hydrolase
MRRAILPAGGAEFNGGTDALYWRTAMVEGRQHRLHLRVLTYNIHKCIGGVDRKYRPERVQETIASYAPDFVLLQEVDEGVKRTEGHRQVDLLGEGLGYRHRTFFPNVRIRGGGHYGNAILSRFPLTDTRNIDLSLPWSKRRSVLHARFRVRRCGKDDCFRTVHVFNLHLGLSQGLRRRQLQKFLAGAEFTGLHPRAPVILAGDFNDVWGNLGRRFLEPVGFQGVPAPLRTFPAWAPLRALDSVYVRGDVRLLRIERGSVPVARWASDHLPLIADLEIG